MAMHSPAGDTALEREDLYASLLHELKNNLVLMSITLEDIRHTGDAEHDRKLNEVRLQCQRIAERLMQALFVYRHAQSGGTELHAIDAYPVEDLLDELAVQARSLRSGMVIETVKADDVPAIWFFDRNMLEIALLNALHNSMLYARARIRIVARMEDDMLCVAIEDDSEGYPEHILQSVALGKPLRSNGTGLGLRFATMIAGAHVNGARTGRLRLRNQGGAVFEMLLP